MTFPNAPAAGVTFPGTPAVAKTYSRRLQGISGTEGVLKCVTPGKIVFPQYIVFQHIREKSQLQVCRRCGMKKNILILSLGCDCLP